MFARFRSSFSDRRIAVVFFRGLLRLVLRTGLGLERSLQFVDPCEPILRAPKIFR